MQISIRIDGHPSVLMEFSDIRANLFTILFLTPFLYLVCNMVHLWFEGEEEDNPQEHRDIKN